MLRRLILLLRRADGAVVALLILFEEWGWGRVVKRQARQRWARWTRQPEG